MTPQTRALIEAAEAFVAKLNQVEPVINGMIGLNFTRTGVQYSGPNYAKEKELLLAAISSAKAAEEGVETLTAEQVLDECDEYCNTKGNPILAPVMRQGYAKDKRMPQAVLVSLNLEPVMMYKRKSVEVREKEGL